ncbi:MAG: hypothetical protein ACYCZQ_02225 [Burkholderiales bacterium]
MTQLDIVILETAIFPDRQRLERSLEYLHKIHRVWRFDAARANNTDRDWDQALLRLLGADRIIVV